MWLLLRYMLVVEISSLTGVLCFTLLGGGLKYLYNFVNRTIYT